MWCLLKKKFFYCIILFSLRASPQTGGIDTLHFLHDTSRFIPEYAIAGEIYRIHTKFYPPQNWNSYKILEVQLLLRPGIIGDTIQSISFFKDTLKHLVFSQEVNLVVDTNNIFPNWLRIIIGNQVTFTGEIEVPTLWGVLCEVDPIQTNGNTMGFSETSQSWEIFHDLPIKLVIQQVPVGVSS